jgi:HK97 family phage major capsid protein
VCQKDAPRIFSVKPKNAYVLFYTTKRVGGGVQDFDAIKLLSFAA